MASSLNRVTISGNLTKDPELRQLPSGSSVCQLRVAVNSRFKGQDGQWQDRAFYFDVSVWGAQGENAAKYLERGSGVIVDGELRWREWEAQDGSKRQAVDISAQNLVWMPRGDGGGGGSRRRPATSSAGGDSAPSSRPIDDDDDIPF